MHPNWRDARVAEEARLESVCTPKGYREFESRSLRKKAGALRRLFCFASELYIPRCFAAAPRGIRLSATLPAGASRSSHRSSLPARRRCAPAREECASRPRKRDDGRVLPPFSLPTSHKSGRQAHLRQKWSKPPQVYDHASHHDPVGISFMGRRLGNQAGYAYICGGLQSAG